jgi:hypothetical protein
MAALTVPKVVERGQPEREWIDWGQRFRQVTNRAKRIVGEAVYRP